MVINKDKKFETSYNGGKDYTINIYEIMNILSEGKNTVQIEVTDEVDNVGKSIVYEVKKDTEAPKFKSNFDNNEKEYITKKTSAKISVKGIFPL